jgi:hypothetical protein
MQVGKSIGNSPTRYSQRLRINWRVKSED